MVHSVEDISRRDDATNLTNTTDAINKIIPFITGDNNLILELKLKMAVAQRSVKAYKYWINLHFFDICYIC